MKKLLSPFILTLLLCSCSHTRYIPLPESHSRDSLSTVVHKKVNNTYIDRTHTESFLHGTTTTQKTTDWGLSLISSFRVDTLVVKDSIYVEKFTDVEVHDTLVVNRRDSVPYPVEVQNPPRRKPLLPFHREDAPRFYHISAWFTILAIVLFIFYVFLRIYLHR